MGLRAIGPQTLGASPQPLWGTTLSAASPVPSPDPFVGPPKGLDPGTNPPPVTLTVVSSVPFIVGDPFRIRPATIDATHPQETGMVLTIVDATHIKVSGLKLSHASGEFVICNANVARLVIQADPANAALLYVGNESTVGAAATSLLYVIGAPASATVQPPEFVLGTTLDNNAIEIGEIWVTGTAGQKYLPYVFQL